MQLCRKECSEYNDVGHEGLYLRPSRLIIITNKQENKALSPNAIMYLLRPEASTVTNLSVSLNTIRCIEILLLHQGCHEKCKIGLDFM